MRSSIVVVACALLGVHAAAAQSRLWRPDERVTISSFNDVAAIAYDGRRVFAATANGIEIYDEIARRWLDPSTIEDGYPLFAQPTAARYDRSRGGLWLATTSGTFFWSDLSGRWESRPFDVPELERGSEAQGDIAARVLRSALGLDANGRRWPVSAFVPAEMSGTYWVGTGGGNILFADARNLSSQWYRFGTLARGTSALALDERGGIWFGGDGYGPRNGIAHASSDLQNWEWYESFATRAPRAQVTRLVATAGTVWAAATDGVYALAAGARAWTRIGAPEGLPSDDVRSLLVNESGVWAGTMHGLALIDPSARRVMWSGLQGLRIYGLAARHDTIWIASSSGIWRARRDSAGVEVASAARDAQPLLRAAVPAIARVGDSIAALAADGVYLFGDAWSTTPLRNAVTASVGRAYDLRADQDVLYVFGTRGVARWKKATDEWSYLTVPADIPAGPLRDVVTAGAAVWLATPAGATRLVWP